jgi:hypothetical protein
MTPPPEFFRVVRHIKIQMEYIPTNKENEKNIIINGGCTREGSRQSASLRLTGLLTR